MKRGALHNPKVWRLAARLHVDRWGAVGILECLWGWAAEFAPAGNVGQHSDAEIAKGVDWFGPPESLIAALCECGWLDPHPQHRLLIHDWPEHADRHVHRRLIRSLECFAHGSPPRLSEGTAEERQNWDRFIAQQSGTPAGPPDASPGPPRDPRDETSEPEAYQQPRQQPLQLTAGPAPDPGTRRKRNVATPGEPAVAFCAAFIQSWQALEPDFRVPSAATLRVWQTEADRMYRIDQRGHDEIWSVARWLFTSQSEGAAFWRINVRSVPKFRLQYERLRALMRAEREGRNGKTSAREPSIVAAAREILHARDGGG